ncbi:MAG: hypothetical protein EHM34_03475 [Nitrosopumilales archaeon]|nr:MAG: hypothetical protein EHM34_03475 [Nitrosopumilales archaeon]
MSKIHPLMKQPLPLDDEEIIRIYEKGFFANEIAKIMKCSVMTILRRLKKYGVVLHHNRDIRELPERIRNKEYGSSSRA